MSSGVALGRRRDIIVLGHCCSSSWVVLSSLSGVSLLVVIMLSLCDVVDPSPCCPLLYWLSVVTSCRSMVTDNELVGVQYHGNGGEGHFDSHRLPLDRKSTRLNSSHDVISRMPSSA